MKALEIENLRTSYGDKAVLHGISIQAMNGSFVGIVGPNGCGKSTMLKNVYRVLKPDSGIIRLDGAVVETLSLQESARRMAVVSQHSGSEFDFSVEEMLLMGRTPHKRQFEGVGKRDRDIVREALEKVHLKGMEHRKVNSLSGGERQRVVLARALVQEPRHLILDEPTNHMDIRFQIELLKLVKGMGLTVVAALHDLNLASVFCDYVYVMHDGEIHSHGIPDDVLTEDMIRDVYGVRAKVLHDAEHGRNHIVYLL